MKKRIGIVFGGNSVEHDISILTTIQASHAINLNSYDVLLIYLTKDGRFLVGPNYHSISTFQKEKFKSYEVEFYSKQDGVYLKGIKYLPRKYKKRIDVILPTVHGKNLEDGSLAGFFKILNIAYASSSVLPAAIFQNKYLSKRLLQEDQLLVVPYYYFRRIDFINYYHDVNLKLDELGYPLIIKPVSLGSSVGIKIANNPEERLQGINYALKFEDEVLVEKKLEKFREFNQAVLKTTDPSKTVLLSHIEEVKTSDKFLTFQDKYLESQSKRIIPAEISEELRERIASISEKIFENYQLSGVIRIDYLYDEEQKDLYVNEVNTIPGSLSYYLFEDKLSFPKLIDELVKIAIKEKYLNDLKVNSFKSSVLFTKKILKK